MNNKDVVGFDLYDLVVMTQYPSEHQIRRGGCDDPKRKVELNKPYYVEKIEIHSWHTKIKLKDINGMFNSVSFQLYKDHQLK